MSNRLKEIVKKIQFKNDWTIEQVANSIGYSRGHLTKELNKKGKSKVEEVLLNQHKSLFQNDTKSNISEEAVIQHKASERDKVASHDALLSVIVAEIASWKAEKTGESVQLVIKKMYKAAEDVAKLQEGG